MEDWWYIARHARKSLRRAIIRRASNLSAANPHNLSEVTIRLKRRVKVGWSCLTVVDKIGHLAVIELITNNGVDRSDRSTSCNVLAIAATIKLSARKLVRFCKSLESTYVL
jgi:hypothetical protein